MSLKRIVLIALIVIIFLLVVTVIFTQTPIFRSLVKNIAISQVNELLNGELQIDSIEGNFLSSLNITNLVLIDGNQRKMLRLAEIKLEYSLLGLFNKRITLKNIEINGLKVTLQQENGVWNLSSLFIENEEKEQPENAEQQPFNWRIFLNQLAIDNSDIYIVSDEEADKLPGSIADISLKLSATINKEDIGVNFEHLSLTANWEAEHSISLHNLAFNLEYEEGQIALNDFVFRTDNIVLDVNGSYVPSEQLTVLLELAMPNLNDISYFVPAIDESQSLSISLTANGNDKNLHSESRIFFRNQKQEVINANINIAYEHLEKLDSIDNYDATIVFNQFDPLQILSSDDEIQSKESLLLNGLISLSGNTLDYKSGNIKLDIDLENLLIALEKLPNNEMFIKTLTATATLTDKKLNTNIGINIEELADIGINISLQDIDELIGNETFELPTDFKVIVSLDKLNIANILNDKSLDSNIRLSFEAARKEALLSSNIAILPSVLNSFSIDGVASIREIGHENIVIDTLCINFADNSLQANGTWNLSKERNNKEDDRLQNYIDYRLSFNNLNELIATFTEIDQELSLTGLLQGSLSGELDSLSLKNQLTLADISFDNINAKGIESYFDTTIKAGEIYSDIDLILDSLSIAETDIKSFSVKGSAFVDNRDDSPQIESNIAVSIEKDEDFGLQSLFDLSHNVDRSLLAFNMQLKLKDCLWDTGEEKTIITYRNNNQLSIEGFRLAHDNQAISLDGKLFLESDEENDFKIELSDISFEDILNLLGNDTPLKGYLNFNAHLSGTANEPKIVTNLSISDAIYDNIGSFFIEGDFSYPTPQGDSFQDNIYLTSETFSGKLATSLNNLPLVKLSFSVPLLFEAEKGIALSSDEMNYVALEIDDFDLAAFNGLLDGITDIKGKMKTNLEINHSFSSLQTFIKNTLYADSTRVSEPSLTTDTSAYDGKIDFNFNVKEAGLKIKELGTSYKNINIDITTHNNRLDINRMDIKSGEGLLAIRGNTTLQPEESPLSMLININNFPVIDNEALSFFINSTIAVSNSLNKPQFEGAVSIPRGRIELDKLLENSKTGSGDVPLLVQAKEQQAKENELDSDSENSQNTPSHFRDFQPIDNATGKLAITFPRNVWIRSSDMNIELSADVEIIKRDVYFELFGEVNVVRGFYAFYGKRFQLERGEIIFAGGRTINPTVSLSASYTFRGTDTSRNVLNLFVSGSMEELDISFELNKQPLPEADAISYLLFGRSFDELSQGEKAESSNQAMLLGGLIANRLAGAITNIVGEQFSLDLIEFRSDTATSQIGVEAGKYLTQNLFVSLKKDFNLSDSKEPVTEEVVVEYEIKPFLYLQGKKSDDRNTGIDLIWRLKWK